MVVTATYVHVPNDITYKGIAVIGRGTPRCLDATKCMHNTPYWPHKSLKWLSRSGKGQRLVVNTCASLYCLLVVSITIGDDKRDILSTCIYIYIQVYEMIVRNCNTCIPFFSKHYSIVQSMSVVYTWILWNRSFCVLTECEWTSMSEFFDRMVFNGRA